MLKKLLILLFLFSFCLFLIELSAYSAQRDIENYYDQNPAAKVFQQCHGSVGKITAEFHIVFKDPAAYLLSLLLGFPMSGTSCGSGFYFDKDRPYVLTNNHVFSKPDIVLPFSGQDGDGNPIEFEFEIVAKYFITMDNGEKYPCKLIASFPDKDMALLLVDTKKWTALKIGDPNELQVGERIFAIGSPLGDYINSVTQGVVSGMNRDISGTVDDHEYKAQDLNSWIQHDAHVNPGNSGGPLLNIRGEVVGINTLSYNFIPAVSGMYFANRIDIFECPQYWFVADPQKKE